VHRHRVETALNERRRQGDGEEDVGRRHRHADAEDEAGHCPHEQQDKDIATRHPEQVVGHGPHLAGGD
jgi:hypothetical protein